MAPGPAVLPSDMDLGSGCTAAPFNPQSGWLSDSGNMKAKPGDCYFSSFPDLDDGQEPAGEVFTAVRRAKELSRGSFYSRSREWPERWGRL